MSPSAPSVPPQDVPAAAPAGPTLDDCAVLIETHTALQDAVAVMRAAPSLALDCEGDMMSRFGSLVMIQIATQEEVFIIDVPAVGADTTGKLLKPVLESKAHKLMWDSRTDSDVLHHFLGIALRGVLDLQIAESLASDRTINVYLKDKINRHKLPCVTGLQTTFKAYSEKCAEIKKYLSYKSGLRIVDVDWKVRPFPEEVIKYAVADVMGLFALARHLLPGWPNKVAKEVSAASERYSMILRTNPLLTEEAYSGYNSYIIPLGVVEPVPSVRMADAVACRGCLRDFPSSLVVVTHCRQCHGQCHVCAEVTHRRLYRLRQEQQQGAQPNVSRHR